MSTVDEANRSYYNSDRLVQRQRVVLFVDVEVRPDDPSWSAEDILRVDLPFGESARVLHMEVAAVDALDAPRPVGAAARSGSVVDDEPSDETPTRKELQDRLDFLESNVADVYCHITGGLLSYPTYDARTVIAAADDEVNKIVREAVAEALIEAADELHALVAAADPDAPIKVKVSDWLRLRAALGSGEQG